MLLINISPPVDFLNKNGRAIEIKLGDDAYAAAPDSVKAGPLPFQFLDVDVNVFSLKIWIALPTSSRTAPMGRVFRSRNFSAFREISSRQLIPGAPGSAPVFLRAARSASLYPVVPVQKLQAAPAPAASSLQSPAPPARSP